MHRFVRRSLLCVGAAAGLAMAVGAGCGAGETDTDEFGVSRDALGAGSVKVTICHVPKGNPENAHTINVAEPALKAHLGRHGGDYLGPCLLPDGGIKTTDPVVTDPPAPDAGTDPAVQ